MVLRYSRGVLKEQYLSSVTVLLSEFIKLSLCLVMIICEQRRLSSIGFRLFDIIRNSAKVSVPGVLFFVQNKLMFVGLQYLDSSTYSILAQAKIITTAIFAVALMKKELAPYQWRALLLLFIGLVTFDVALLVQMYVVYSCGYLSLYMSIYEKRSLYKRARLPMQHQLIMA